MTTNLTGTVQNSPPWLRLRPQFDQSPAFDLADPQPIPE